MRPLQRGWLQLEAIGVYLERNQIQACNMKRQKSSGFTVNVQRDEQDRETVGLKASLMKGNEDETGNDVHVKVRYMIMIRPEADKDTIRENNIQPSQQEPWFE